MLENILSTSLVVQNHFLHDKVLRTRLSDLLVKLLLVKFFPLNYLLAPSLLLISFLQSIKSSYSYGLSDLFVKLRSAFHKPFQLLIDFFWKSVNDDFSFSFIGTLMMLAFSIRDVRLCVHWLDWGMLYWRARISLVYSSVWVWQLFSRETVQFILAWLGVSYLGLDALVFLSIRDLLGLCWISV